MQAAAARSSSAVKPPALPVLPRTTRARLLGLVAMALGFYALAALSVLAIVGAAVGAAVLIVRSSASLRGFGFESAYAQVMSAFGLLVLLGLMVPGTWVRIGSGLVGVRCGRRDFASVYALADEVARKVGATPVDRIYLVPGMEAGVMEEGSLWRPPGTGARSLLLGMALLDRLTLEQLKAVLAHEYGHLVTRDTSAASQFVWRVRAGFRELLLAMEVGAGGWNAVSPVYWALWAYGRWFDRTAAGHSRLRELHADRYAVEAFGVGSLRDALVTLSVEVEFFREHVLPDLVRLSRSRLFPGNVYREAAQVRLLASADNGETPFYGILVRLLTRQSAPLDTHPALAERLRSQGVKIEDLELPVPPRVAPSKEDATLPAAERAACSSGPPSAAESLFGSGLRKVQVLLSGLMAEDYRGKLQRARTLRNLGI